MRRAIARLLRDLASRIEPRVSVRWDLIGQRTPVIGPPVPCNGPTISADESGRLIIPELDGLIRHALDDFNAELERKYAEPTTQTPAVSSTES